MTTASFLRPNWPAPPCVRSLCSLREGGVSCAPYDSLNLGDHVGDDAAAVAKNRLIYAQTLQAQPVFLQQVHGWQVAPLRIDTPTGTVADACVTAQRGVACTIMVADCLPVLICNRSGSLVGAGHAGWRGLCGAGGQGVIEQLVQTFRHEARLQMLSDANEEAASECLVWLGPCIGPSAFEVGEPVREAFLAADSQAAEHFRPQAPGKYLADLAGLARQRLAALGVQQIYGNDSTSPWCTVSHPSRFFSHRRDRICGRFAASVWLA